MTPITNCTQLLETLKTAPDEQLDQKTIWARLAERAKQADPATRTAYMNPDLLKELFEKELLTVKFLSYLCKAPTELKEAMIQAGIYDEMVAKPRRILPQHGNALLRPNHDLFPFFHLFYHFESPGIVTCAYGAQLAREVQEDLYWLPEAETFSEEKSPYIRHLFSGPLLDKLHSWQREGSLPLKDRMSVAKILCNLAFIDSIADRIMEEAYEGKEKLDRIKQVSIKLDDFKTMLVADKKLELPQSAADLIQYYLTDSVIKE